MSEPSFFQNVRSALGVEKPAPVQTAYVPAATFAGDIVPYAAEALNREVMNVAAAPSGTRNDTLNIAAVKLGSLVAGGHLPPALVLQELTNAALAAGLEAAEVRATLNSGLRKGEQTPREIPDTDKELDQWLNTLPGGPARPPAAANASTPERQPAPAPPNPQNGTQPPAPAPAPWEVGASAPQSSTSTNTELPWAKTPQQGPASAPAADTNTTQPQAAADDLQPPQQILNRETALELLKLQARAGAARLFNQQNTNAQPPAIRSLTTFLQQPDEPVNYRVHGLLPAGGRVVLAAQYKAGKSSMIGNLVKCLADGRPFLDSFATGQSGAITVIDDELSEGQLRRWFREQQIKNTDAVHLVPLRGALSTFDILDPVTRSEWAGRLRGTEFLILDCLRPVMDALGLSEDKDAGKFLVAFDALLAECGASEAVVVHHMGHGGNRSRGDSRILDWPDATWSIKREDPEDPNSPRYFEALGRDVKVNESLLVWDPDTRGLRIGGGGRAEKKAETTLQTIVEFVKKNPNVSGRGIQTALRGNATANRNALNEAVNRGLLRRHPTERNGFGFVAVEHPPNPSATSATECDRDPLLFDRDQTP